MVRSNGVLSLLVSLAWVIAAVGCGGEPTPPGAQAPGGAGGMGGIGGLPGGGSGGGTGRTGPGGSGGVVLPGDCQKDPGTENCARCLDDALPSCLMQNATDCPEPLGAFIVCAHDNGCMKDNGLPDMACEPCVGLLSTALDCMKSCRPVNDCL